MSERTLQILCYGISACAMIGAGGYLIFGANKSLGIFLLLCSAILSRVLVLNIAMKKP